MLLLSRYVFVCFVFFFYMVGFTYDDFAFGHNHICFNFHEQNQIMFCSFSTEWFVPN